MAQQSIKIVIDMLLKGQGKAKEAANELRELEGNTQKAGFSFRSLAVPLAAATGALAAVGIAAKQVYNQLREGAVLQTTALRFDKLSQSIGRTSDALLGDLKMATQGMISDAELMASASQIISLKLADNSEQVTRLATVVGTLGWDMQQVILTFANMSTMRLDALGLSVEEVTSKAKELEAAGMSAQQAFKEAVILAGESRLDVGGVSDAEKAFKQWEASIANVKNELALTSIELARQVGLIDAMGEAASRLELLRQLKEINEQLVETGKGYDSWIERLLRSNDLATMSTDELRDEVTAGLREIDNALLFNQGAWQGWAIGVQVNANLAAEAATRASGEMFRALTMSRQLDWMGGRQSTPTPLMSNVTQAQGFARWVQSSQNRARQEDSRLDVKELRGDYERATQAVGGYSGALSLAAQNELALAEAHAQMASAFTQAIASPEDALFNADGAANIDAMNRALYQQAQAAGATAGQLAILGVATGQFSKEQAIAALRSAVLMERIKRIAQAVVAGNIGIDEAVGNLNAFREQLESGGGVAGEASDNVEGLAGSVDELISRGPYSTTIKVNNDPGLQALRELGAALNYLTTTTWTIPITSGSVPQPQPQPTPTPMPTPTPPPTPTVPVPPPGPIPTVPGNYSISSGPLYTPGSAEITVNINGAVDPDQTARAVVTGIDEFFASIKREGVNT